MAIDLEMVRSAGARQRRRQTAGIQDMPGYLAGQVGDHSHREVIGPLLAGTGASGVVRHGGRTVAGWGDPDVPEMLFSATKSFVGLVAGVAHDQGFIAVEASVADTVRLPAFETGDDSQIT
jgi:CubicO group peptidase (beta-lactamase class C family)